jgi:hypothetical protein
LLVAVRGEAFDTRNEGSLVGEDYDETGWSAMISAKHEWEHVTALLELIHVSSRREDREDVALDPRQAQTQIQAELRMHW